MKLQFDSNLDYQLAAIRSIVDIFDVRQKLYFVVESKGSIFSDAIRSTEQAKIDCGKRHFEALKSEVQFTKADNFENFMGQAVK